MKILKLKQRRHEIKRAEAPVKRSQVTRNKRAPTTQVVKRVIVLAQALSGKKYYPYQVEFCKGIVEAILEHDGEVVTALLSRQCGKTQGLAGIILAICVIFPQLAKMFPDDERLNMRDDHGTYRGFKTGISFGIYAPKYQQATTMFDRIKEALNSDLSKEVLHSLGLSIEISNGITVKFSNGSVVLCNSASTQSKVEGATHDVLILEEAQDIDDTKVKKSLHPMVASTNGTIIKIGTATTRMCDFYQAIKTNERLELVTNKRRHFFYPYTICQKYNSQYARYIEQEKIRLGENSDEFLMSYGCRWIFERGMFITQKHLFNMNIAQVGGYWGYLHPTGVKSTYPNYSLCAGIDWGETSDSTVLTIMAVDWQNPMDSMDFTNTDGRVNYEFYEKHIIGWCEWTGDSYETQYQEILPILKSLPNLKKLALDSNACGRPMYSRLVADLGVNDIEVLPCPFNLQNKSDIYKALNQELQGKRVTFPASPEVRATIEYRKFIQQMLDLQKKYTSGLLKVHHPDDKNAKDDYPDSFALANYACMVPVQGAGIETFDTNPFFNR